MTTHKKLTAAVLALLSVLLLSLSLPCAAWAEKPSGKTDRFNVVLAIDKSGSLCCEKDHGTDPDGLRYEALKLFLGLLTESGNNVGTVVFDEQIRYEAEPSLLEGMEAKEALIGELAKYYPCDDTDIGKAMLRATEMLRSMKAENDLPCMIVLFSDGMTDFTTGDVHTRFRESWEKADRALTAAREEGITINGILLNVADAAEDGRVEMQLYTSETKGAFEEVKRPEDLGKAFQRFYAIINHTVYTGAQRVAFSDQGEAEIFFTVPSFGVEEVNVIVEGEDLYAKEDDERVAIEVFRPAGDRFDITGHALESARYRLVKIPNPDLGIWRVLLRGEPDDLADITMVCNASLSVRLTGDETADPCRTYVPYTFTADVTDPGVPKLNAAQLQELYAVLAVEDLSTGTVREYAMDFTDGVYTRTFSFARDGDYRLSAVVGLGDFKVRSNVLDLSVELTPLVPKADTVTDMLQFGHFRDALWELDLGEFFGVSEGNDLQYRLSDDCGGALQIENGILQARLQGAQAFATTLTAQDQMGQQADVSFDCTVPEIGVTDSRIANILAFGEYKAPLWEAALSELFHDPKGFELQYTLSNDYGGAVRLEDGFLRADLEEDQDRSFTLTAENEIGQRAKIAFDLTVPTVSAKLSQVTNMLNLGSLHDFQWELPLDGLFYDSAQTALTYTLSDDHNGAVTIENDALHVDLHELREVDFDLTASNALGRQAVISFAAAVPGPVAAVDEIAESVKTGLFQKGIWERDLKALFRDPKGTALHYTLSDDLNGAASIENGVLRVNMKGLKKAVFTVIATDEYGLSAEIPVTLTGKNMTPLYSLLALCPVLIPAAVVGYRRRH